MGLGCKVGGGVEVQVWTVASLVSIPHMEMQHMEMQVEVFCKPDGIKFSKSSSETKAVKKIQREVENGGVSYTISGMKTAPPCGGSHPAPKWDD